ncbi:MAG: glutamate--tRNA ligase [Candidatus Bathyarchaeota archaeon]
MRKTDKEQIIRKHALQNAIQYGGTAKASSVMGKVLAECPDLKSNAKELMQTVVKITEEVNSLSLIRQEETLKENWPDAKVEEPKTEEKKLPPLPNIEKYTSVHVRFSPNPDGALHLGGARAAILCDEYAKMYNGMFTLRFDDSDPRTKSPIPEAYEWIKKDLEWLGVTLHNTVYQSDRLEIYYGYTKQLLEMGVAYVCTCKSAEFRKLVLAHTACPCRNLSSRDHLARWTMMLEGRFDEGEAVVRVKTDLNHPNPAVREWPALRVIDTGKFPHPRTGSKYRVWPLFAFCCGIDDHDLQITHIIRGKEHLTNTTRQIFLYNYLQWVYPEAIHYGRLKIVGTMLSKSKVREGIVKGIYKGWDDPRLGTLIALRKRGFLPETVRQLILDVGPKPVDATISWDNFQALNRKLLDPVADRYFFVATPLRLDVKNVKRAYIVKIPLHPSNPDKGTRNFQVEPKNGLVSILFSKDDLRILEPEKTVRLMGLFNITLKRVDDQIEAIYHSETYAEAKRADAPLIHWIPSDTGVVTSVVMPDASSVKGLAEDRCRELKPDDIVQFERFGFIRVDIAVGDSITAYYAHR